jgi:hypothetical protein
MGIYKLSFGKRKYIELKSLKKYLEAAQDISPVYAQEFKRETNEFLSQISDIKSKQQKRATNQEQETIATK